ncbi:MAG: hypothetical protein IJ794_19180 [Lachnospiraceae bacterium]|nr:hypothetical protein [Lachnospiraceae bacterium]
MLQWIRSAWQGWASWIGTGKLPALLFAALLYLLMGYRLRGAQRKLVYYGGGAALLALCPVTAAFLMKYQTAFYDYPFIWSIVPVTMLIAFGVTVFLWENWRRNGGFKGWMFNAVLVVFCGMILYLSGGMGPKGVYVPMEAAAKEKAQTVWAEMLPYLQEAQGLQGRKVCLWAPQEILETARMQPVTTAGIEPVAGEGQLPELLYGRNMWDAALNAYTYDVYPEEVQQLYLWMEAFSEKARTGRDEASSQKTAETAAETDEAAGGTAETAAGTDEAAEITEFGAETDIAAKAREKVELAFSLGVNCVLLPKGVVEFEPDAVKWADIAELSEYYLLIKQP